MATVTFDQMALKVLLSGGSEAAKQATLTRLRAQVATLTKCPPGVET